MAVLRWDSGSDWRVLLESGELLVLLVQVGVDPVVLGYFSCSYGRIILLILECVGWLLRD